jgi:hypothetical protein
MHAAAVALLQWQDTKLDARMAALLQWQVVNLLHRVKDEQTCNSNNKARCIPAQLCKLSRGKAWLNECSNYRKPENDSCYAAGYQTACTYAHPAALLPCCTFSNCMQAFCSHCNTVTGYHTACTNARCCPAAVAEYQTA